MNIFSLNAKVFTFLFILLVSACVSLDELGLNEMFIDKNSPPEELVTAGNIAQDVFAAVNKQDFRLLASTGRRIVVIGIKDVTLEVIKESCGIKFIPNSGDVLRGENDKKERRLKFKYALIYNQQMSPYCLKNN